MQEAQTAITVVPIPPQRSWRVQSNAPAEARSSRPGSPIDTDFYIVPGTGGHGRARADALLAVIHTFGCRVIVYGYDSARGDTFLVMTGTRPALDALGILLPQVSIGMEGKARAAARAYARKNPGGGGQRRSRTNSYFREYLRGYGRGVAEQVKALRTEVFQSEGHALRSVVAADNDRTERRFAREFPVRPPIRRERTGPRAARRVGAAAGRTARIDSYIAIHDLVFAML